MDMSEGMESGVRMERIVVGELWRLSALVLLYESVHRVGGLHPVLRNARYELLNLLDSLTRSPAKLYGSTCFSCGNALDELSRSTSFDDASVESGAGKGMDG